VISVLLPHPPQSSNSSNYAFTRKTWIVGQILSFQASNKRVCKIVLSGNKLSKAREQLICDTWKSLQFSLSLSLSLSLSRLRLRSFVARCARKKASPVKHHVCSRIRARNRRRDGLPVWLTSELGSQNPTFPTSVRNLLLLVFFFLFF
jgi:hypothetical protein